MSHSHQHSCQCSHDNVSYYKVCRIVHCLSCNQEWGPKFNWNYTPWYNSSTLYGGVTYGGSGEITQGTAVGTNTVEVVNTCNHGK